MADDKSVDVQTDVKPKAIPVVVPSSYKPRVADIVTIIVGRYKGIAGMIMAPGSQATCFVVRINQVNIEIPQSDFVKG
jgi:hypothetical protein